MAAIFNNDISSPIVLDDTSTIPKRKTGGKPKSIVWGTYIKQGKQISKGHWNATCNFCGTFWYKGSPTIMEDHLGNLCAKVPAEIRDLFLERLATKAAETSEPTSKKRKLNNQSAQPTQSKLSDYIESTKLTPERNKEIARALVKAFIICGIPFHIIENPFFIELLKTLRPAYEPPSKDVLFGRHLAQETAFVNQAIIKELKNSENLTLGIYYFIYFFFFYKIKFKFFLYFISL